MRTCKSGQISAAIGICALLSGCGTTVPQVGEIWDTGTVGTSNDLELLIKTKLFCELAHAVSYVNGKSPGPDGKMKDDIPFIAPAKPGEKPIPINPIPETWGVLMTLQLVIIENTAFNPVESITPGAGKFVLGTSATVSSDATRTDKFSFYYPIKLLYDYDRRCLQPPNNQRSPFDNHGSSLLLESDVGILPWLNNAGFIRTSTGISVKSTQEVLSYDAKFDVVTTGTVSPSWKLSHLTTQPSGNLFSTKRDRTHQIILTFGPSSDSGDKKKAGSTAAAPSTLVLNSALASEFGTAAGIAFKNAIGDR